ncbi:hypothetical protein CR513_01544, partial [Mucuna pruriens]
MDRSMINAASRGVLMDKTPTATRHLIYNMASNTQQFGVRGPNPSRLVSEIGAAFNQRLENQLTELTLLVRQLAIGQHQTASVAKVCGICTSVQHPIDMCPTLLETESDQPENRQAGYQQPTPPYQAPSFQQQQQQRISPQGNSPSLEDLMKQLATSSLELQQFVSPSNMQFQQNMTATIQDLKTQIGQLANTVSQLQSTGSSNLPSQTIPNPRGNVNAVTLRSGKELSQPAQQLPRPTEADSEPNVDSQSRLEKIVLVPFPTRTISTRKPESDEELLKMFRKVEINIPLLDAIKQIPKYAKFLNELCVYMRKKMKGSVEVGGIVSTLTRNEEFTTGAQQALPKKCRDLGIFSVSCTIGECTFADAMLDFGASIIVMPTLIYKALNFGNLKPTGMTIQLANRGIVQPQGVIEDVLVQVNELIFPVDFYVLDMEDDTSGKGSTLILERPFHITARTKIDVHVGTLSMEFGDRSKDL